MHRVDHPLVGKHHGRLIRGGHVLADVQRNLELPQPHLVRIYARDGSQHGPQSFDGVEVGVHVEDRVRLG